MFRPNVERVISQVATRGGRRLKLRYLGTARNNAWLKNRTAALNLRNLISRGLACRNGTWTLAHSPSDHHPAGTRPLAATPPTHPGWLQAGRATTLPARKDLAHCRTDGLAGALPAPDHPLFRALLAAGRSIDVIDAAHAIDTGPLMAPARDAVAAACFRRRR